MSIYRKLGRIPPDDLHHFERQRKSTGTSSVRDDRDWLTMRKAMPYERLLAATVTWCSALPSELQPHVLCATYPRIANGLASGWRDCDATLRYFDQLLTDHRGGRRGFPADVLQELHALKAFYETQHPREGWRRA